MRDADAGTDLRLDTPQQHALPERVQHPFSGSDGLLVRHAAQQYSELVTAEARQQVPFAQRLGKALRHHLQEQVPVVVAEGVVDLLEPVEVHQQHGDRTARLLQGLLRGLAGDLQGVRQMSMKLAAVRQPRQRIMLGVVVELLNEQAVAQCSARVAGEQL